MPINIQSDIKKRLLEQVDLLKQLAPIWYDCIDMVKLEEVCSFLSNFDTSSHSTDFESQSRGGRGEKYRLAQQNSSVRFIGIKQLFNLISPNQDFTQLTPNDKVLDVLGGDGVLARALLSGAYAKTIPSILTSDLAEDMVKAAISYQIPAIRQPAQKLLLKDNSTDAVIIAYGTHHIPQESRIQTCLEAYTVLKPGGYIVLHDFEKDSPVAQWFEEVVDKYSIAGHKYTHFTTEEMHWYLSEAGFEQIKIQYLYDPFILSGNSSEQVMQLLAQYLYNMYGLVKLGRNASQSLWEKVYGLAKRYFQYDFAMMNLDATFGSPTISISRQENHYMIEMPRVALVGIAQKPLT